jgi:hypothetical protein
MIASLRLRVGALMGTERRCDRLTVADIEAVIEERFDGRRRCDLEHHAETCPDCAELLADARLFARLTAPRVRATVRRAAAPRPRRLAAGLGVVAAAGLVACAALVTLLLGIQGFGVVADEADLIVPPVLRTAGPLALIEETRAAVRAGELAAAERLLEEGLERWDGSPHLLHNLGIVRLHAGRPAAAAAALSAADRIQEPVPSPETRFWLGVALAASGRRHDACRVMASVAGMDGERAVRAREVLAEQCPGASQSTP